MSSNAFPFSVPVQLYLAGIGPLSARAQFLPNLPGNADQFGLAVVFNDNGEAPAGLYIYTGRIWQLCIPYAATNDYIISGGSINIYYGITSTATPQSGAVVYRNGVESTAVSLTPNANITWATIFTNPTSGGVAGVTSFNGRAGVVALLAADVSAVLPIATATVLGAVKIGSGVTVASDGTISVSASGYVLPNATTTTLGGVIVGAGLAVTAGTVSANVLTVAGRAGAVVLAVGDVTGAAPLASPTFTGTATAAALTVTGGSQVAALTASGLITASGGITAPAGETVNMAAATAVTAPTIVSAADSTTNVATTAFVHAAITAGGFITSATAASTYAPLASPTLTGVPAAPTAAVSTNTTQLATTAYVIGQAATATPLINGAAAVGTSLTFARADHVHPTDTTRAALASPTFTGTVTTAALTATGLVTAAGLTLSGATGLTAGTGAVALATASSVTVPTATAGTSTTVAASTAFVTTALTAGHGFPYDILIPQLTTTVLTASQILYEVLITRSVIFPAGAGLSLFSASNTATASTVLRIMQGVTQVGTITYGVGSVTGVVSFTAATTYTAGQSLYVQGPASADSTLAGVYGTLSGSIV